MVETTHSLDALDLLVTCGLPTVNLILPSLGHFAAWSGRAVKLCGRPMPGATVLFLAVDMCVGGGR